MKKKKIKVIIGVGVVLCIAAIVGVYYVYPQYQLYQKYQTAKKMYYQIEKLDEALEQFRELGGFKDSEEWRKKCEYRFADRYIEEKNYDDALAIYEEYQDLENYKLCLYQKATDYMQSKKYDKALPIFQDLGDYEDSRKQVNECNYQIAEGYYNKKKYRKAIEVFKTLGNYRQSAEILQECYKKLRFANFDYETFREYIGAEEDISKSELKEFLIECMESEFYGTWYEENSDTEMVITEETINGRQYGLFSYQGKYDGEMKITIKYFYFDEPDKELTCSVINKTDYVLIDYWDVYEMCLENKNYATVTSSQRAELDIQLAQAEAERQRQATRSQMLSAIYSDIKSKTEYDLGNKNSLEKLFSPLAFTFPNLENVFVSEGNNTVQMQFTVSFKSAFELSFDKPKYSVVNASYNVDYDAMTYQRVNIYYTTPYTN